ncbi:MAG: ADP-forming succinate--CoA ligase subunit beta [Proteobacteria bacterium]|nr:ADP-forming succinate--CoA ligase subunit beta [Pseudomonadota bacterium]
MNLHEYQAKQLLETYHLPVPRGEVAWNVEDAVAVADRLHTSRWVVKAQVHAGGRGKAGGVQLVSTKDDVAAVAKKLLGTHLVTYQTDANGQPVNQLLIEETSQIEKELYLGAVIDRASRRVVVMASTEGGVEIEKVAEATPEKIFKFAIDPLLGVLPYQAREMAFKLGLNELQVKQFTDILMNLGKMFIECDMSLLEINPLVITKEGKLICLDAKINLDDNALYRQPKLRALRDPSQEDERVNRAHDWELNYIPLDGDIGCMVNGAGLAMATMDLVKLHGGKPANFLDVGGGATKERVSEAFKIILSDQHVKGILVNIFGGIVRCDLIAEGIIGAVGEVGVKVPVVVRLEGNNAELGAKKLRESGLNIIPANGLTDAAKKIVAAVGEKK